MPGIFSSSQLIAFVATTDAARAKAFYADRLGLPLVSEDDFAVVFDANGTTLRVAIVKELHAAPYTVLGWAVQDIDTAANELRGKGIVFEIYPWMQQQDGIWTAPGGTRVAWFKDPDGNTLSISQH
jgi:catechol 2,3-dioxygenase-like lactoylglutathione lyase family enzyme